MPKKQASKSASKKVVKPRAGSLPKARISIPPINFPFEGDQGHKKKRPVGIEHILHSPAGEMKPGALKNIKIKDSSPSKRSIGGMRHTYAGVAAFPRLGKLSPVNANATQQNFKSPSPRAMNSDILGGE